MATVICIPAENNTHQYKQIKDEVSSGAKVLHLARLACGLSQDNEVIIVPNTILMDNPTKEVP